jgi:hypothetical protein
MLNRLFTARCSLDWPRRPPIYAAIYQFIVLIVRVLTDNWTLALHGRKVFSDAPAVGPSVPFFLMPSLGGHNTLRGYYD